MRGCQLVELWTPYRLGLRCSACVCLEVHPSQWQQHAAGGVGERAWSCSPSDRQGHENGARAIKPASGRVPHGDGRVFCLRLAVFTYIVWRSSAP